MKTVTGVLSMAMLWTLAGVAANAEEVHVTGERVNLRVRPVADSEVVAQAGRGDVLTVTRSEGDWLAVRAPTNAAAWVKAEFMKDGVVLSERLNIRCGPGLSYRDAGVVHKGDRLTILEKKGEWLRIPPSDGLVVWVSRRLVAPAESAGPAAVAVEATTGTVARAEAGSFAPTSAPSVVTFNKLPDGMTEDQLAPVLGQGAVIERQGIMERVPLAFVRGVEFRLAGHADGRKVTVCFVRGDEQTIVPLLNRRCVVKGRGYWLNGERAPLLYADSTVPTSESN